MNNVSMKVRLALGIPIVLFFVFHNVKTFYPRDPYKEMAKEEKRLAEREAKRHAENMRVRFPASDAYLLSFSPLSGHVVDKSSGRALHQWTFSKQFKDAILSELIKRIEPHGINRSYNEYDEAGDLGTIHISAVVMAQSYSNLERNKRSGSVISKLIAEVTMQTNQGEGLFEGTRKFTVSVNLPSEVSIYGLDDINEQNMLKISKKLAQAL